VVVQLITVNICHLPAAGYILGHGKT